VSRPTVDIDFHTKRHGLLVDVVVNVTDDYELIRASAYTRRGAMRVAEQGLRMSAMAYAALTAKLDYEDRLAAS
jgi:hypothetical protein